MKIIIIILLLLTVFGVYARGTNLIDWSWLAVLLPLGVLWLACGTLIFVLIWIGNSQN